MWRQLKKVKMKLVIIASILFMLNISIVIVDELDIYNFTPAQSDNWRNDLELAQEETFDPDIAVDVATSFGFGDFISGFKITWLTVLPSSLLNVEIRFFMASLQIASTGCATEVIGVAKKSR